MRQWYKLTGAAVKQLRTDGVDDATLEKVKPILDKAFSTDQEFVKALSPMLKADEIDKHKSALVKRAQMSRQEGKNDGGSMATIGQLLVGHVGVKNAHVDPFLQAAPEMMRKWQEPSGAFRGTGQLPRQNRSAPESDAITTGWAILGLDALKNTDAATKKTIEAGLAFYRKTKASKSHERLLVDMLIDDRFGKADDVGRLMADVLKRQNADGGWGWIPGNPSDAFATGQTLYALHAMKTKVADRSAIGKAQQYLLSTQNKEGYWAVSPKAVTDPKSNDARVKKLDPIYHYWGTAWATIGLARSVR